MSLLGEFYDIFSIEDGERGETDWVEMTIDTGDVTPRKQNGCHIIFAAWQEVACQLHEMQQNSVIEPSNSSWANQKVLVHKKDFTVRYL